MKYFARERERERKKAAVIAFCVRPGTVLTVKTCRILHNFVRQRDGLQFQGTLYECPLESIKAVGNRGNVTGTDMGKRAQRT